MAEPSCRAWIAAARELAVFALAAAALGMLWQGAITAFGLPKFIVPTPASVIAAAGEHYGILLRQAGLTLASAAIGLVISLTLAALLSASFVASRLAMHATMPLVMAFRSAPVVAIAPIVMLLVGRGIGTSVIVVVIVSFFPLLVNLMRGLSAIDPNTVELLRVYGASRAQQLRLLRVPFALPYLFTGLRVASANALLGAMLAEWITGSKGLGFLILNSADLREVELLWAAVLVAVVIAVIVFRLTSAGERRLVSWR
jgi:NitT/TauT family transport system permease protein